MGRAIGEKAAFGAWGAAAGLVGSLCCVGPGAAALLGLGSASALWGAQVSRPVAWALGAALLALGALLAWRRQRSCTLGAARWRNAALLVVCGALSYALLGLLLPAVAAQRIEAATPAQRAAAPTSASARRLTLNVAKMECRPCVAALRGLLRREVGVRSFFAEPEVERVTIDYDGAVLSADRLLRKLPAKYDAQVVSDAPLP